MAEAFRVENLLVYQRLCDLHIEISDLCRNWPREERFELASQARRASNSSPANLAEKHNDRHVRNKIEGVNRARGEALETVHHLYIAHRKSYLTLEVYESLRERYLECVRMLNGLERNYEKHLDPNDRTWPAPSPAPPTSDL
jgi:four helix bundle protein